MPHATIDFELCFLKDSGERKPQLASESRTSGDAALNQRGVA